MSRCSWFNRLNCGILILFISVMVWPRGTHAQSERFASVDACFQKAVQDGTVVGGVLLVSHGGSVVFEKAFGFEDLEQTIPFGIETPVVVASISKPLLGTALHRLVDQGNLKVDVPIDQYLPEFKDCKTESGEAVNRLPSVTELLTHTSGLRHDSAKGGRVWYQAWTRDQTMKNVVAKIASEFPFKSQPGTKYAYSGIGTEVAARIGEVASKLPRNELIWNEISKPLGMKHTFYVDAKAIERLGRALPKRYLRSKKTGKLVQATTRPVAPTNRYCSSGGGIISTAPDLLKWLSMILNHGQDVDGKVYLSKKQVADYLTPHSLGYNARGGLFVRKKDQAGIAVAFGHTGSTGTNVWVDFVSKTIGIMLTQTRGSDIKPFRVELENLVMKAIQSESASASKKVTEK